MLWILRVMLVLLPGLALAQDLRPAEVPPADFPARQYIDSKGCVFLLDPGGRWQARVARDGAPICGYPPTLSARGQGGRPRLRALDPNAGRSRAELLEAALSQTVITAAQPGELTSDPQPMQKLPDMGPEPMAAAPVDALRATVAAAPAVRQDMGGGLKPNLRLCELLGYDGRAKAAHLGDDPSQGYCNSLPEADLSRLSFLRPVGSAAAPAPAEATAKAATDPGKVPTKPVAVAAKQARSVATGTVRTAKADVRAPKPAVEPTKARTAKPQPETPAPGMIPAGARYVQLGTFGDPGNADRAAQRVAGLGHPVLRGKDKVGAREVQIIMAGPFKDRKTIVRALDSIRRAGFRDAFPR